MWKLYNDIPCYNIRIGQVVELDVTYGTPPYRDRKSFEVKGLSISRQNNCNHKNPMLLVHSDTNKYSPIWINGNMCRNCIYHKEDV